MDGTNINPDELKEYLSNYNDLKENNRLFIKACNAHKNQYALDEIPNKIISNDIAITFHVLLKEDDTQMQSVLIDNGLFKKWEKEYDLSVDDLYKDALKSSQLSQPVTIQKMESVMAEIMGTTPDKVELGANENFFVISTNSRWCGAATLFYPDTLEKISKQMDGNGFYIFPSSQHEILALNDNSLEDRGFRSIPELSKMIREINDVEVKPEDYLSDTLYHYDAETRIFETAISFEKRIKGMELNKPTAKKEETR